MRLFSARVLLLLFGCIISVTGYTQADLILVNGKMFTAEDPQRYVEALAIKDNRILAVGTVNELQKHRGDNTRIIDVQGRVVVPGFNDAHNHLPAGLTSKPIIFSGMDPTWNEVLDSLVARAKITPRRQWIEAPIGLSIASSPASIVNRLALDRLVPNHPVRLNSFWGHVCIFNTIGLEAMGIHIRQPDPKGGFYDRFSNGTLTGRTIEKNAYFPHTSYSLVSKMRDKSTYVAGLKAYTEQLLRAGITSYQNMCTGATPDEFVDFWTAAGLPFRLRLIRWGDMNSNGTLFIPSQKTAGIINDLPMMTVSGTKWLLEGTPLEQGAYQIDEYPNRPGWHGRMNYTPDEIKRMCQDAITRRDQLHFHIGGSKSIGMVLDIMSTFDVDWKSLRPRFEHGDQIDYTPAYIDKAKKMGVIIVQNPTHFAQPPGLPPGSELKLGAAMKTLLKNGIPLAIGSDGPFNPYLNILLATTHPMRPAEALTREEAVIAYTSAAAYAEFMESEKGSLTAGKLADLAVLSQDIFTVAPGALPATRSVLTIIDGKIVYDEMTRP